MTKSGLQVNQPITIAELTMQNKIDLALHSKQGLRVKRFLLPDGRSGEPCELIVVAARRWANWRQIKAGRKAGAIAAQRYRQRNA